MLQSLRLVIAVWMAWGCLLFVVVWLLVTETVVDFVFIVVAAG